VSLMSDSSFDRTLALEISAVLLLKVLLLFLIWQLWFSHPQRGGAIPAVDRTAEKLFAPPARPDHVAP